MSKNQETEILHEDRHDATKSGPSKSAGPSASPSSPCCHDIHSPNGRNLVGNLDGTSNKFGTMNTNVIELYSLLDKDESQLTWYNSGIGTYARPSWRSLAYLRMVLHNKIDLAIAWDFEKTVLGAYQWLSENYKKGDRIFLFGFSRGAFQVRVLSAMIAKVGLIHKGNEMQIPFAYELYADPETDKLERASTSSGDNERISIAERFKRTFSHKDVKVHFVGVWDTVSSIGVVRESKMLPGTTDGMGHVCFFRHALALDERRVKFLPEFAYGGKGIPKSEEKNPFPQIKEVWFAGTHSDIGGGNAENPSLDRTRPPLRWMVFEAGPLGLRTSPFGRDLHDSELVEIKESLTCSWWFLELFPIQRLTYSRQKDKEGSTTRRPHVGKGRKIQPGQKIHSSLLLSTRYVSKAAAPEKDSAHFWETLKDVAQKKGSANSQMYEDWVELDLSDHIKNALQEFILGQSSSLNPLRHFTQTGEGQRALYDAVMNILVDSTESLGTKERIMKETIDILKPRSFSFQKRSFSEVLRKVQTAAELSIDSVTKQFMCRNCDLHSTIILKGHTVLVPSVAFSKNGTYLVSGSYDHTIRLWDAHTGSQIGYPLHGHTSGVTSIAISPDGKHIISGSYDKTLILWDIASQEQVGKPWEGHTDTVRSVAFAPDGERVVSGSYDGTVCFWDVETAMQVGRPLTDHNGWVWSVAYSPDGTLVASGGYDTTIRIWNAVSGEQVGKPLEGHTHLVMSVSFSPDGKQIVSGSYDDTIRLWDVGTHQQVGEPLRGHTGDVNFVSFSPDGRLVASGSDDNTVRIWDVETQQQIGEPLRGHTDWVQSVVFSPNGKRVASASDDRTIRIWDIEDYITWSQL